MPVRVAAEGPRGQGWMEGPGKRRWRRAFSPGARVDKAVSIVISSLTYGRRFEYDDPRFLKLLERLPAGVEEAQGFLREILNSIPELLHIPGLPSKLCSAQKTLTILIDELVQEHRTTRDPTQPPRDLTDAFLDEVEKAKGSPKSSFNDENLGMVTSDLLAAGMVSASATLTWALLLMILHPDVQPRVQQEIDEVIGRVQGPEMRDQTHMPFTMAVVHEVQRFGDIIPRGLLRMTSQDPEVQGFLIPKGTRLITSLSSVLKDEKVWKKPLRF